MRRGTKVPTKKIERFLNALARGFSVQRACDEIGIARKTAYKLRQRLPDLAERWAEAIEAGTDYLEDEARRRAAEGVSKPVFYQGEQCGSVQEFSDTLLIFLLKGRRPEKFRDNINLDVSGAIQVEYCNDWRGTERVIEADAEELEVLEVQAAPAVKALVAGEPESGTNRTE